MNSPEPDLWESFSAAMRRLEAKLPPGGVFLAALSGGVDSVVLLHLLARYRDVSGFGGELWAAHLNHSLRGSDADGDLEFCRSLAGRLGIPFFGKRVDVAAMASGLRMGLEEAGRLARYGFFADLAGGRSLTVLTGHHADDQAETILLNLRRGAHRRGLSGMREFSLLPVPPGRRLPVGRPLLRTAKDRIEAFARAGGLVWREDGTNADVSFARNRVRRRIIPALEAILPGFRERLLRKAEILAREEDALSLAGETLAKSLSRSEKGGRFFSLVPDAFADHSVLAYAFRHVLEGEMGGRLPYGAVLARLERLAEAGKAGECLSLPGNLLARRETDGIFFFFPEKDACGQAGEIILPDPPFSIVAGGLRITASWRTPPLSIPDADRLDGETEHLDPSALRWPLRLRKAVPGERMRPLGAPGGRKIQDILTDMKIPRRMRDDAWVVADHAGAVWLWPHRLGERVRLTPSSRHALRLEIRRDRPSPGDSG